MVGHLFVLSFGASLFFGQIFLFFATKFGFMLPFSYRNFEGNRISSIESGAFQNVQGPGCTLYVLMSDLKLID